MAVANFSMVVSSKARSCVHLALNLAGKFFPIQLFDQFCSHFQIIQRFVIVDLSNFYFDIAKDRLYVG